MGGLKSFFSPPKVDKSAQIAAEKARKDAEDKLAKEQIQSTADEEYRRKFQRGKAATVISTIDDQTSRSMLGN